MDPGLDSRRQFPDRPEHGLAEFIWSSGLQSPVKSLTYICAGEPKLDVVLIVHHQVLEKGEPESRRFGVGDAP